MSTDLTLLQQSGALAIPSSLHSLMQQDQSNEMAEGVGPSYAVVTIKGKTFGIRHGGNNTPMTVTMNGAVYAAPFFDVAIIKASAALAKTYYKDGYKEGDTDSPDCWSEDGINPLAPMDQRPVDPRTNAHCVDCRACPMNAFGSRISDNGSKAKACADTRKIVLVPVQPTGQVNAQGHDPGRVDFDNSKFGGPMMLRVPAASLKAFAEYSTTLQGMGIPYYGVVTRMQFDPAQAYPKFVLQPVRGLTEQEGQLMVELRQRPAIDLMLTGGHTAAAPVPALAAPAPAPQVAVPAALMAPELSAAQTPPPAPQPAPVQVAPQPAPVVTPQPQPMPATAAPVQPAPVVQQAPPPPPPPPVQAPPPPPPPADPRAAAAADGWQAHPTPGWMWQQSTNAVLSEADVLAKYAAPTPPPPPAQTPPPVPTQPVQQAPVQAQPMQQAPAVTASLLEQVDSLLAPMGAPPPAA